MLKAIAIDDEPIALEVIRTLAAKVPFLQMETDFNNAIEGLNYLKKNSIDLLFLDIQMPDLTGIELLRALPSPPMVIFTTAFSDHAVQSFELDAVDYLLKPFSLARFLKACHKAQELQRFRAGSGTPLSEIPHLFIKSGYELQRVDLLQLLYIESNGNYLQFVLPDQKIMTRLTIPEALKLLPANAFQKIHRSYIVSLAKITRVDRDSVWLGKTELPLSDNYRPALESRFRV